MLLPSAKEEKKTNKRTNEHMMRDTIFNKIIYIIFTKYLHQI